MFTSEEGEKEENGATKKKVGDKDEHVKKRGPGPKEKKCKIIERKKMKSSKKFKEEGGIGKERGYKKADREGKKEQYKTIQKRKKKKRDCREKR